MEIFRWFLQTGPLDAYEQRIRQAEAVQNRDSHEWTDAECLAILAGSRWRGGAIDKAAWQQLGKLRGFL